MDYLERLSTDPARRGPAVWASWQTEDGRRVLLRHVVEGVETAYRWPDRIIEVDHDGRRIYRRVRAALWAWMQAHLHEAELQAVRAALIECHGERAVLVAAA